ncbi:MAG: DUF4412 domain-containing protein [Nitrospiraceae bacterium]|nr:DUF4412 domain-containing protein [Nitrospiraceae bacterium]
MKNRVFYAFILLFSALVFFPLAAAAMDFSADMVTIAKGHETTGKIFLSGKKARMETGQAVTISRMDKMLAWILMPDEKMYIEQPLRPQNAVSSEKMPGEVERKFLGSETVEGRRTKKYRITYALKGEKSVVYAWIDNKLGVPVKTTSEDGSWTVLYRDIKTGKQPSGLFEVPAGYKKTSFGLPDMFRNGGGEENNGPDEKSPKPDGKDGGKEKGLLPGGFKLPKLW